MGGSARATTAVTIAAPPPQSLSYPSPSVLSLGQATAITPSVTGLVTSYEISPSLPGGLTLSPVTGVIFGTPNQASAEASYVVTARNPAGATSFTLRLRVAIPRATADRPDEVSGYQIHVMYVIPGNGTDQALDTSGTLAGSVASWQSWFEAQTGGRRLRLDTFAGGNLDVTFLELPRTDAALQSAGIFLRDRIEYLLLQAGFDDPDKLYLVYYGGTSTESCGSGPYPPSLPGSVTGVYLLSAPPGGAPCATQGFARADEPPRYLEFLAAHEVLHGLGMAPTCAPNYVASAHVGDSPDDLMYAGTQPWTPRTLDVNRDDYFGAGRPGCADLANSAFLSPLPASAEPPAGWPYDNLTTLDCALEPTLTPSTPGALSYLTIVSAYARNGSSVPVDVWELRTDGFGRFGRWYLETLALPGDGMLVATRANSYYVASVNGACVALLRPGERPGRFVVR